MKALKAEALKARATAQKLPWFSALQTKHPSEHTVHSAPSYWVLFSHCGRSLFAVSMAWFMKSHNRKARGLRAAKPPGNSCSIYNSCVSVIFNSRREHWELRVTELPGTVATQDEFTPSSQAGPRNPLLQSRSLAFSGNYLWRQYGILVSCFSSCYVTVSKPGSGRSALNLWETWEGHKPVTLSVWLKKLW